MNKLTINHGSFNLDEIDLDHGTITIGRATDNDIRLDDSAVSSHHAKIVTFFNVTYIEDLDSTNGTIVNGRVIKKYTLHTGDIVLLGKHQLLFQGSPAPEETGNADATVVMSQSDVQNAMANNPEDAAPMNSKPMAPPMAHAPAAAAMSDADAGGNVLSPERSPSPSPAIAASASAAPVARQKPSVPNIGPAAHTRPDIMPNQNNDVAVSATPANNPAQITERPMRAVMENITANPAPSEDNEAAKAGSLDSLEKHNDAFSLLNDDDDNDAKINTEKAPLRAFDADESLLIPAFIKSDKTSVNIPPEVKSAPRAVPSAPATPIMRADRASHGSQAQEAAPTKPVAPKKKPARKVLEDPSASFGDPIHHSAPMGINEIDRVNQYRQKSDATNPGNGMPAVGDRTLLKQIITGDSSFSPSRNKFEIIQIVLGFVIFAIIALIAFASF